MHNSASSSVETVGDLVELAREKVPKQVERHGRGLVPEHLLHVCDPWCSVVALSACCLNEMHQII